MCVVLMNIMIKLCLRSVSALSRYALQIVVVVYNFYTHPHTQREHTFNLPTRK